MNANSDRKVNLAIIGCGGISGAHARGLLAQKDKIDVVALCDISEANLKARSEQLGGVEAQYDDWNMMLSEMGDKIDGVIICLPHHLHAPVILDVVKAGKNLLCEKPMCINMDEAAKIVKAVQDSGVIYMSAHNQLFMESVQEAKRRIDDGEIGQVYWIRSQDCFTAGGGTVNPFKGTWRSNLKSQGGGELIDTGYHPTYRLLYLAGADVVGVRGTMGRYLQAIEGEDTASVQVRFANGVIGEILTSWALDLPYGTHHIHILGEKGQMFGTGNDLFILRKGETEPTKIELPSSDQFERQVSHFADCLLGKAQPVHGPVEGAETLKVILGAAEDAEGWQQYAPVQVEMISN